MKTIFNNYLYEIPEVEFEKHKLDVENWTKEMDIMSKQRSISANIRSLSFSVFINDEYKKWDKYKLRLATKDDLDEYGRVKQ